MNNLIPNIKKIIPVKLKIHLLKIKYFFSRFQYVNFPNDKIIISPKETLSEIKLNIDENNNGAYIRFGDGDIFLINNKNKHRNQNINSAISQEMKDVISMKNNGLMKSLAIHSNKYGMEALMKPGSHERPNWEADYFINKTHKFFLGEKIYSPVSLHYQLLNDKSDIVDCIRIIKNKRPIFVGSEKNDKNILSNVFGVESFVKTPHRNAYSEIDEIELELKSKLNVEGFNLVLLSCGP
ncbi:GT-D fold domain-containing glycosyltransferase, partial [Vibrio lentus]